MLDDQSIFSSSWLPNLRFELRMPGPLHYPPTTHLPSHSPPTYSLTHPTLACPPTHPPTYPLTHHSFTHPLTHILTHLFTHKSPSADSIHSSICGTETFATGFTRDHNTACCPCLEPGQSNLHPSHFF